MLGEEIFAFMIFKKEESFKSLKSVPFTSKNVRYGESAIAKSYVVLIKKGRIGALCFECIKIPPSGSAMVYLVWNRHNNEFLTFSYDIQENRNIKTNTKI